ncbi:hypothetical protein BC830DRAFT_1094472 [Chytriomyces sp. MP71]|nr:hypothetical protein BC830DRAFT_1094472 [Chytriomyces sp. MP71]
MAAGDSETSQIAARRQLSVLLRRIEADLDHLDRTPENETWLRASTETISYAELCEQNPLVRGPLFVLKSSEGGSLSALKFSLRHGLLTRDGRLCLFSAKPLPESQPVSFLCVSDAHSAFSSEYNAHVVRVSGFGSLGGGACKAQTWMVGCKRDVAAFDVWAYAIQTVLVKAPIFSKTPPRNLTAAPQNAALSVTKTSTPVIDAQLMPPHGNGSPIRGRSNRQENEEWWRGQNCSPDSDASTGHTDRRPSRSRVRLMVSQEFAAKFEQRATANTQS